jgi:uncharacterized membrane-anchored protein
MADFADRSLGVGYTGGATILFLCLMATLGVWYWTQGSISVETVDRPKVEVFIGPRSRFPNLGHRARRLDDRYNRAWL